MTPPLLCQFYFPCQNAVKLGGFVGLCETNDLRYSILTQNNNDCVMMSGAFWKSYFEGESIVVVVIVSK